MSKTDEVKLTPYQEMGLQIGLMWEELTKWPEVWIVTHKGAVPLIEDPEGVDQEDYMEGDEVESSVKCFLTKKDAVEYKDHAVANLGLKEKEMKCTKYNLAELFECIEEWCALSKDEHDCNIRLELVQIVGERSFISDILWSQHHVLH